MKKVVIEMAASEHSVTVNSTEVIFDNFFTNFRLSLGVCEICSVSALQISNCRRNS